jgi:hypothetical protein
MDINTIKSKLLGACQAIRHDFELAVMRQIQAHPEQPYWMIAEQAGISEATVLRIAHRHNISRPAGPRPQTVNPEESGL